MQYSNEARTGLIDLGAASRETKGSPVLIEADTIQLGKDEAGIADD
jgi:hypothetical protein